MMAIGVKFAQPLQLVTVLGLLLMPFPQVVEHVYGCCPPVTEL